MLLDCTAVPKWLRSVAFLWVCMAQRPKQPKRRRRRRAHTPPDTTDDEEEEEEEEQGEGEQAQGQGQGRRRRPRAPLLTRLRRWWRRRWFHLHRRYLLALRRKDLPRWRAVCWDVAYRCGAATGGRPGGGMEEGSSNANLW